MIFSFRSVGAIIMGVLLWLGYGAPAMGTVPMPIEDMANKGDADAQFSLGCIYYQGKNTPLDFPEAMKWFKKAAEQGNGDAQFALGTMYYNGESVPIDYEAAVEWFQKAAEQGNADAQETLGRLFGEGKNIPFDVVKSYIWSSLSARRGSTEAAARIKSLSNRMTPEEIAEAQKKAADYSEGTPTARQ